MQHSNNFGQFNILPILIFILEVNSFPNNNLPADKINQSKQFTNTEVDWSMDNLIDPNSCGYFNLHYTEFTDSEYFNLSIISENKIINVYTDFAKNEKSKSRFNNVSSKVNLFNGQVTVKKSQGCQIEICGYVDKKTLFLPSYDDPVFDWFYNEQCYLFSNSPSSETELPQLPFLLEFKVNSMSCKCQKNGSRCANKSCFNLPVQSNTIDCAVLFQEDHCQECTNQSIILRPNDFYNTTNKEVIRSLTTLRECRVRIEKRVGYSWVETISSISPDVYKEILGFSCNCSSRGNKNINIDTPSTTPKPINPNIVVIVLVPVLIVLFSLSTIVGIYLKIRLRKQEISPQVLLTEADIKELLNLLNGESANFVVDPSETSNAEIVSFELLERFENFRGALNCPFDPESKFEIDRTKLSFDNPEKILGKGGFGVVYKGTLNLKNELREVAIKTVGCQPSKADFESLINEIKIISFVGSHPNIVEFIGACTKKFPEEKILCIMELCEFGSLKNYLVNHLRPKISFKSASKTVDGYSTDAGDFNSVESNLDLRSELCRFSKEIATGMEYLGKKNVLHIDLAAKNILVSRTKKVKICDFGLSKKLYSKLEYEKNANGFAPVKWIALECITERKYSIKSDVWAYAVTIWEIFSLGLDPYAGKSFQEIFFFLQSGERLYCPLLASQEIYEIMKSCWHSQPKCRPEFAELKDFFENVESMIVNLEVKND